MRALITGASGFLGKNLIEELRWHPKFTAVYGLARTPQVEDDILVCNLENHLDVERTVKFAKPDVIFHLAANPLVKLDEKKPFDIIKDNVLATQHLLHYAPKGCRFVFASSAAVYGNEGRNGYKCNEGTKLKPTTPYGATKVASESLVGAYTEMGRVSGISLRLVANVGPHSTHGLLHELIRQILSPSSHVKLLGDCPGSIKPFVYVRDTSQAFIRAAFNPRVGIFNVSTDDPITVETVAEAAMTVIGVQKPILWQGKGSLWQGDNPIVATDSTLFRRYFNWKPMCETSTEAIFVATQQISSKLLKEKV